MLGIELDINSGLTNPVWLLTEQERKLFIEQLTADRSQIRAIDDVVPKLDYRGFVVNAFGEDAEQFTRATLPTSFRLNHTGVSDHQITQLWLTDITQSKQTALNDYYREMLSHDIQVESASEPAEFANEPQGAGMSCRSNYLTSSTDFSFWNGSYSKPRNNCYNFASNYRSNTFAQPGKKSGTIFTAKTYSAVRAAVRRDGYKDSCESSQNISIFLVTRPENSPYGWDFHFYRFCANSRWCHKPGSTNATNKDSSNQYISNPRTCNRGSYTVGSDYFYKGGGSCVVK